MTPTQFVAGEIGDHFTQPDFDPPVAVVDLIPNDFDEDTEQQLYLAFNDGTSFLITIESLAVTL